MKPISPFFLSLIFSLFSVLGFSWETVEAQDANNLVPNPSFEEKDGRLRRGGQIYKAKHWVPGTGEDADLFTKEDDDEDIGAPETYRGRCNPKTGSRFAGVRVYSYRGEDPRSYISAQLPESLSKGVLYCVQFHVRLSPLSKFAVNNVGAYLSKKDISTTEEKSLIFDAQVVHPEEKIHKETRLWKPVCSAYQAKGGEEYITIGSFVENDGFQTEKMRRPRRYSKSQFYDSYYFVDDVSIKAIDNRTECQCYKEEEKDEPKFVFSSQSDYEDDAPVAEKVEAHAVYFASMSKELESNFKSELDDVAEFLKEDTDLKIKILGHADQEEQEQIEKRDDDDISLARAKRVLKYLKEQGVSEERMEVEAMQDSELQSKGKSQYLLSKNRRVTFKVQ